MPKFNPDKLVKDEKTKKEAIKALSEKRKDKKPVDKPYGGD